MDAHLPPPAGSADATPAEARDPPGFAAQVKSGVIWRSGSQLIGQLIAWTSTFLVIRMLNPADYGLVAMTGVVLTFLDLFKGWGSASSVRRDDPPAPKKPGRASAMRLRVTGPRGAFGSPAAPPPADFSPQP